MVNFPNLNFGDLLKSIILAAALIVGTIFGVILRAAEVNGFIIWIIVGAINTVAAVYIYLLLKREFVTKETAEKAPEKKQTTKSDKIISK